MERETYELQLESSGSDYKTKKQFRKVVGLTEREYLGLVEIILTFLDGQGDTKP